MKTYLDFNVDKTVRLHGRLSRYVWSRLYYYIKSLSNSGYVKLKFSSITETFKISNKTLYRWLLEGFKDGAFRFYECKKDILTVFIGSKYAICKRLNLSNWGGTIEVPARQLLRPDFYSLAAQLQTMYLQRKSVWAAKYNLDKQQHRSVLNVSKFYSHSRGNVVNPSSLVSSDCDPFNTYRQFKIRHLVDRFALVSKRFVPIGATQKSIGASIGVCDRTVRNHLIGVDRLQFCYPISKAEYQAREFAAAESWSNSGCFESSNQYWKYGPNIYDLDVSSLKSERFQRLYYQFYLLKKADFLSRRDHCVDISNCNSKELDNSLSTQPRSFKKFLYNRRFKKSQKSAA